MRKVKQIVIHHSETPGGDVRFLRHIHVHDNGWKDVGYHLVICNGHGHGTWPAGQDGEVQPGRHLDSDPYLEPDEYGAHAYGYNGETVGICLIGNAGKPATVKQMLSLIDECVCLCRQFSLGPEAICGHRDLNSTTCPGDGIYDQLHIVRLAVGLAQMGVKG